MKHWIAILLFFGIVPSCKAMVQETGYKQDQYQYQELQWTSLKRSKAYWSLVKLAQKELEKETQQTQHPLQTPCETHKKTDIK